MRSHADLRGRGEIVLAPATRPIPGHVQALDAVCLGCESVWFNYAHQMTSRAPVPWWHVKPRRLVVACASWVAAVFLVVGVPVGAACLGEYHNRAIARPARWAGIDTMTGVPLTSPTITSYSAVWIQTQTPTVANANRFAAPPRLVSATVMPGCSWEIDLTELQAHGVADACTLRVDDVCVIDAPLGASRLVITAVAEAGYRDPDGCIGKADKR